MSSDPIELNQDGAEENEAAKNAEQPTANADSTEETLNEENEENQDVSSPEESEANSEEAPAAEAEEAPAAEAEEAPAAEAEEAPAAEAEEAPAAEAEDAPAAEAEEAPAAEAEEASAAEAEEASAAEAEEAPAAEAEEPATEKELITLEVEAEDTPDATSDAAEAEEATEEEEEEPALEVGENFSEEAMLKQIDQILDNETNLDELIQSSTPNELIFMLDHFYKAEEVQPYIRRVGLIKRAFDGVRDNSEVPKETLSRFSTALARFNKKRSEYQAAQDQLKEGNSEKKRELLAKLKEIVDAEDVNKINEVREIQQAWKDVGHVKREDMEALFREYRFLLDSFYKNRELHFQLRDYDRQINLKEKERLLEELKTIIPEESDRENRDVWVAKNDLLTDIQMRWRAIGHVPREDMDRINDSYREITGQFFAIRREFFESQDGAKKENEEKKRELLEKMKAFEEYHSEKPRDWNSATEQLRVLQEEWKEIGPAPKEVNSELWKAYRNVGNAFFGKKAEFFRQLDEKRNDNLNKKRELCEKAEAMAESGEFEKTARELRMLQEEWKNIGPVPERYSNKLWARFRAACDKFFEGRRQHYASRRSDEDANLERKRELIVEVQKVSLEEAGSADAAIAQIKDIQARWKAIGRVPYKDKDTIWKEFRAEIDQFFDDLRANRDRTNYANLKEKVETLPEDKRTRTLKGKIQKLRRKMEAVEQKVEQYSTNILFISKGKSGDGLRAQIQKEIDKENRALQDMRKQMRQLNDLLKNPPAEEKEEETAPEAEAPATPEAAAPEASAEETTAEETTAEEASAEETSSEEEATEPETAEEAAPEADASEADNAEEKTEE
jgi:hypothetical protein